jgi:hypothetical protein
MIQPTDTQLATWLRFAQLFPESAKAIHTEVRSAREANTSVARTQAHGAASSLTRWNNASVQRTNIATGYTPESLWASVARRWTAKSV